jgi:DNA-binding MarR family transcriptional regulator
MRLPASLRHVGTVANANISGETRALLERSGAGPDAELVASWRTLLDQHARVSCALERALDEQHDLGVSEFEVLDRLAVVDNQCSRIQEIAESVHLSQSALSRVVARLEADGLVARTICQDDRRGIFATLTDAGRARHAAAAPTHRDVLRQILGG